MKRFLSIATTSLLLTLSLGASAAQAVQATLQWAQRTPVSTLASGEIVQLAAPGRRLAKGETLCKLDPATFDSRVKALEAIVKNAREQRTEAKAELDRNQEMYDQTMLALHDLQVTKLAYIQSDADYRKARAELAQARFMQQQSHLRAPFNAVVLSSQVAVGETLNNAQSSRELMVIASSDRMAAVAEVELEQALALEPGRAAKVLFKGREYQGRIDKISFDAAKAKVEVGFPLSPGAEAVPGQTLDIEF